MNREELITFIMLLKENQDSSEIYRIKAYTNAIRTLSAF